MNTANASPAPPDYSHNRRFNTPFKDNHRNPITGEVRVNSLSESKIPKHRSSAQLNYQHGSLLTSDIQGASPTIPAGRSNPRSPLFISDIEGASAKKQRAISPRNPLSVKDIEGASVPKVRAIKSPRNPLYVADIVTPKRTVGKRKDYDNIDYSDVSSVHVKCPSVDLPRMTLHRKGQLVTEKQMPEPLNYEEMARQGMELVRAIGSGAARILRDARKLKGQARRSSRHVLSTPAKDAAERREATPSKSTADSLGRRKRSRLDRDISAVYARL